MDDDFSFCCCIVVNFARVDFPLFYGTAYGIDNGRCRFAIGDIADDKRLVVELVYLGTNFYVASTCAVVVVGHVDASTHEEIGVKLETFALEVTDGCIADFIEVVWQYFGR